MKSHELNEILITFCCSHKNFKKNLTALINFFNWSYGKFNLLWQIKQELFEFSPLQDRN